MKLIARALLLLGLLSSPVLAVEPSEMLADPELEARARVLSKELRCLVCRNESIDDSNATLARDLRLLVRERISEGDSDAETMDYIVDRYGEFVLLRPRVSGQNLLLWLSGPVLLVIGLGLAVSFMRNRAQASGPQVSALDDSEKERLKSLLED